MSSQPSANQTEISSDDASPLSAQQPIADAADEKPISHPKVQFGAVETVPSPSPLNGEEYSSEDDSIDDDDDDFSGDDEQPEGDEEEDDDTEVPPLPPTLVSHLLATGNIGSKPLHAAAASNDIPKLKELLIDNDTKQQLNDHDVYHYTPIHVAAENGSLEACETLISFSANIEAVTKFHASRPLHYAAFEGHVEIITALLNAGADINALTDDNRTPLFQAAFRGHFDCVEELLKSGADPDIQSEDGKRPVDVANKQDILTLLEQPPAKKART